MMSDMPQEEMDDDEVIAGDDGGQEWDLADPVQRRAWALAFVAAEIAEPPEDADPATYAREVVTAAHIIDAFVKTGKVAS